MAEATALYEKENGKAIKMVSDYKTNVAALEKAIAALEKGLEPSSASFLQSGTAEFLRKFASSDSPVVSDEIRESLTAFLGEGSSNQEDSEAPPTSEVIGMLKQMKDTMEADLKEMETALAKNTAEYQALKATKDQQIEGLEASLRELTDQLGELMVRLVQVKGLIDQITGGAYLAEKKLLDHMIEACKNGQHVCDTAKRLRAEEATALSQAISLLDSEESFDLLNKATDHMSLLQVEVNEEHLLKLAHSALNSDRKGNRDYRLDAICLAMTGKKVDMSKVIAMIDKLVAVLKQEETDELEKKEYCITSLGQAAFQKRFLDKKIDPIKAKIEEVGNTVKGLTDQITALTQSITELDQTVEDDGVNRKKDSAQYTAELASDKAALDLLKVAKQRLTSFYNFLQGKTENFKPQSAGAVLDMIDKIIHSIEMHMEANSADEKAAQKDYEEALADAAASRTSKVEMVEKLTSQRAEADSLLQEHTENYAQYHEQEKLIKGTILALHKECDFLVKNYDIRVKARASEIAALRNSKAVLSGAISVD